jgi:hypothetical protein
MLTIILKKNAGSKLDKLSKISVSLQKKKVVLKKKKFFLRKKKFLKKKNSRKKFFFKKKKLDIFNKCLVLNNRSLLFELKRKIVKKKIILYQLQTFLKLKFYLKKLYLNSNIFDSNLKLKPKNLLINSNESKILKPNRLKRKLILDINIQSNNIFLTISKHLKKNIFKTVKFWSIGSFNLLCSKAKLKFTISVFLKEIKFQIKGHHIFAIKVKSPKYLNKYILKQFRRLLFKPRFFIYPSFKIFNGCRSKKKRRKKRLRFRYFR